MSVITDVQCAFYRVKLESELGDSMHGSIPQFELFLVTVTDSDGAVGTGYTYAVNSGAAVFKSFIDGYLSPLLIGSDPDLTESLWQRMWWKLHYSGRGGHAVSAIAAVDIALWDMKGRRVGLPLWRLWGGFDPVVPVYAGGVDLNLTVPELLEQADRFISAGHRAIKMKVGRPALREDIERVAAMREHLGDDFPLMADANMRWSITQAGLAVRELGAFNLFWIEEPVIPDDWRGHAQLARGSVTTIATGENLHSLYEFSAFIGTGEAFILQPDVAGCGGMTVFRKVAALTEANNLPLSSHGAHDLTIQLMATAANRTYMEIHAFSLDRFVADPLKIVEGTVAAAERPGHGVEFDLGVLEGYRVG